MPREFQGKIELTTQDSTPDWGAFLADRAPGGVTYTFNFLDIPPEQRISAPAPASGRHVVGVDFVKDRMGENFETIGTAKLHIDDEVAAEDKIRTIAAFYALCGEGLCIGYDSGDTVSSEYKPKFEWTGGEIIKVVFDVADDAYVDVERLLAAAMARD